MCNYGEVVRIVFIKKERIRIYYIKTLILLFALNYLY